MSTLIEKINQDYTRYDLYIRSIGIPVVIISLLVLFSEAPILSKYFFYDLAFMVIIVVGVWYYTKRAILRLNKSYPWHENPMKRLGAQTIVNGVGALLFITICTLFFLKFVLNVEICADNIAPQFAIGFLITVIINMTYESSYFFEQWKRSLVETESFKKESIQAKYQTLKNQVDPHFLFNNFNTLSSLIDIDVEAAKKFLDEFSEVYRYVLNSHEKEFVSLKTELEFVRAYLFLMEKRHGDALRVNIDVSDNDCEKVLPPMALQMLLENAIKHNVVSKSQPLVVEIFIENENLLVKNNLQRKKQVYHSTGIGLKNINSRYNYYSSREIEVRETLDSFIITLPLLDQSEKQK